MGVEQSGARAIARFALEEGARQARESKICRQVTKDIRFLAKGPHPGKVLMRRAQRSIALGKNIAWWEIAGNIRKFGFINPVEQ